MLSSHGCCVSIMLLCSSIVMEEVHQSPFIRSLKILSCVTTLSFEVLIMRLVAIIAETILELINFQNNEKILARRRSSPRL